MRTLRSYLQGAWHEGAAPLVTLHNAATGEPCAQTSTNGLDRKGALDYARRVGGPALRALSFAERGAVLKAMSEVMHGARDELIELAQENSGNTRSDAKFDVDGAMGTLATYARLGSKLGDGRFLIDGEAEPMLRSKRFVGQHLFVPRRGVAIHINAFNFPAWGLAEKAAIALLAGVPVLTKPGTSTAVVATRMVELWDEAGVLPPGALSILSGSAGDLLDHVGPQDVIAFTGSGGTARRIKSHPAVMANNVTVNVEADSLNAAVLGPDVEAGSDTYEMFIRDVVRDLTQKAGQKCTAIRRIFVPEAIADAVIETMCDRLAEHRMGDPTDRTFTVGPLASGAQHRDVLAGIETLSSQCERVFGTPGSEPDAGYYVAPQVFRSNAGLDAPVHEHEVFGPVATVLPWSGDAEEAVELVAAGGGGLVASMYSDDVKWAGSVLMGLAPWHGRVHWGSKKVHDQSPGPGTVLPNLVHGGPGKAGGGEELGGTRGMRLYLQRTAVQADRALLQRVLEGAGGSSPDVAI